MSIELSQWYIWPSVLLDKANRPSFLEASKRAQKNDPYVCCKCPLQRMPNTTNNRSSVLPDCQGLLCFLSDLLGPYLRTTGNRKPGLPWHSAFSQIRLTWFSLCQSCEGNLWELESGSFPAVWHGFASWFTGLWDIQHLENRLLCFRHQIPRGQLSCVSWLSSERGTSSKEWGRVTCTTTDMIILEYTPCSS